MEQPIERLETEPEPESDGSSVVMRVGYIVASGVLAALAASLPAALRMGDGAARVLEHWVALAALATPMGVIAVAVLKRARVGLRLLVGERAPLFATGVLWWCVIELGLLSIFGAVLRKTTHHHALAGVTFSVFAVVTGLVVALLARRATKNIARGGGNLHRVGLAIAAGAAFIVLLLVGVRTSKTDEVPTAAALVDALALLITSTITSSRPFSRFRPMAIAGVPVAVLIIIIGLTTLRFDPQMRESLFSGAPIHGLVLSVAGR